MRRDVSLYINGKRVDLDDDALILFNYRFEELSNPTVVKNSYSQQVTLRGTSANNAVFGAFYRLDRRTVAGGFDARVKVPFVLFVGDEIAERGYCKIDSVERDGADISYKVSLFGGLGSFFYALSYDENGNKKTLSSLDYGTDLTFQITAAAVRSAWERLAGKGYDSKWDVINFAPCYEGVPSKNFDADKIVVRAADSGLPDAFEIDGEMYESQRGDGNPYTIVKLSEKLTGWQAHDLRSYWQRGLIRIKSIIEAICKPANNGGYTVTLDENFFSPDNEYYEKAWLSLPQIGSLVGETGGGGGGGHKETVTIDTEGWRHTGDIPIFLSGVPVSATVTATLNLRLGVRSRDSVSASKLYMCNKKSDSYYGTRQTVILMQLVGYDANNVAVAGTPVEIIQTQADGFEWYTAEQVDRMWNVDFNTVYDAGYGDQRIFGDFSPAQDGYAYGRSISLKLTGKGINRFDIRTKVVNIKDGSTYSPDNPYLFTALDDWATDVNVSAFYWQGEGENTVSWSEGGEDVPTRSGSNVTKEMLLKTDFTPADYLISYAKMFGLCFLVDKDEKSIQIVTRNAFFQKYTAPLDLSDRVDLSKSIDVRPFVFDSRWLEMTAAASGAFADEYKMNHGKTYGAVRINTGYEFNTETRQLLDNFAFKAVPEVLDKGKYYNKVIQFVSGRNKIIPSAFLAGGQYRMWKVSDRDETKDYALTVPSGAAIVSPWNAGLPGYDTASKPQMVTKDGKELDIRDVLLLFRGVRTRDPQYWNESGRNGLGHVNISDDFVQMLEINDGVPCWFNESPEASGILIAAGVEYYPEFGRFVFSGQGISRELEFDTPTEIDIPDLTADENASVFARFWGRYLADRYDVDAKVMRCSVDLQGLQVGEDLLRRFFYFRGAIWALNTIENHSMTTYAPTMCEFVKVRDIEAYSKGQDISTVMLKVTPASLSFAPGGGSQTIKIESNTDWTITKSSWLTLSRMSGSGTTTVTVTASSSSSSRTGSVTVTAGSITRTVDVTQEAATLDVSPSALEYKGSGGSKTINIISNVAWSISAPSWVTLSQTSGNGNATITATVNLSESERSGRITVTGTGATKTVSVSQAAFLFKISPDTLAYLPDGGSKTITVECDDAWSLTVPDWVTLSQTSGSGTANITVTVAAWASSRKGSITGTSMGVKRTVSVTQESLTLSVSPTSLAYVREGGTKTLTITCNGSWTMTLPSWVSASQTSGSGGATVTLTVARHSVSRTGTITVTAGSITRTVSVRQTAYDMVITPSSLNFFSAGSKTVTIETNAYWEIPASKAASWITFSRTEGDGDGTTTVTVGATSADREGTFIVEMWGLYGEGLLAELEVNVSQFAEDFLDVSPTSLSYEGAGGNKTITIESNVSWNISAPSWVTLSKTSGSGNSNVTATVASSTSQRSGTITVTGGGLTKTISVSQTAQNFLDVTPTTLTYDGAGSSKTITIKSNVSWTISTPNWVTLSKSSGSGEATITATVGSSTSERSGSITVTGGNITRTVAVSQTAQKFLNVSPASLSYSGTGGSKTITIESNVSWSITAPSWVTLSKSSGSGNYSITATVGSSTSDRSGTISVAGGGITKTVSVDQSAQAYLTVSPSSLSFAGAGGSKTITIESNTSWSISAPSWVTLSKSSGSGDATITATVSSSTSQRSGTISVTGAGTTKTVSVSQTAQSYLTVSPESLAYIGTGGSKTFTIESNVSWSISAPSWVTLSQTSGSGDATITATVARHSVSRTGTITVTAGSITRTVSVRQTAYTATVTPSFITFFSAGSKTVTIETNAHWEIPASKVPSWVTLSKFSGDGNATVTVTVGSFSTDRSGTFNVEFTGLYGEGLFAELEVTVEQLI